MKSDYLEQLKSDIAARFERDLGKPRAKPAVKPTMEEDAAFEQQKQDFAYRLPGNDFRSIAKRSVYLKVAKSAFVRQSATPRACRRILERLTAYQERWSMLTS